MSRNIPRPRGLIVVLTSVLMVPGLARAEAPRSALPPEARAYNERGVALIVAGEQERGVEELERAYALMPDALMYRAGRGKVLGAMRGALNQLYASSGDPRHLCRLRDLQERHLRELRAALGASLKEEDVAGSERVLAETRAALARRGEAEPCAPAAAGSPVAPEPVPPEERIPAPVPVVPASQGMAREVVPPLHPPRTGGRGLQIGGGVGIAVGLAALGAMSYGVVVVTDARREIERRVANEPMRTDEVNAEIAGLYRRGSDHRTLAVITGVLGGLSVITGAVLVGRYHRSVRRGLGRMGPVFGPQYVGMSARLRF